MPQVATTAGLALAMAAVGFLMYFIHHVAASFQSGAVSSGIARDTLRAIDVAYPDAHVEEDGRPDAAALAGKRWQPFMAYIESVDCEALVEFARPHGVVVRTDSSPGRVRHSRPADRQHRGCPAAGHGRAAAAGQPVRDRFVPHH